VVAVVALQEALVLDALVLELGVVDVVLEVVALLLPERF
jgi:hypothetical protein